MLVQILKIPIYLAKKIYQNHSLQFINDCKKGVAKKFHIGQTAMVVHSGPPIRKTDFKFLTQCYQ